MNKKRYMKPSADYIQLGTADNLADEIVFNTSNFTIVDEPGELNAKGSFAFFEDEEQSDAHGMSQHFKSIWEDE